MGYQINSYYKSQYTGQQIENALSAFKNMAAEYSQNESYNVGDVVLYGNGLYVCTGSTTGAFDPTKWQQTTLAEIFSSLGATYTDPNSDGNVVIGVDSTVGEKILRSLTFPGLTNRYYLPFAQYIRERLQNDPSAASFGIEIPDAEEAPMHSTVIKGKTVAVNQLSHNVANSSGSQSDVSYVWASNKITLNGTATSNFTHSIGGGWQYDDIPAGHTVLLVPCIAGSNGYPTTEFAFRASDNTIFLDVNIVYPTIYTLSSSANRHVENIRAVSGTSFSNYTTTHPMVIDLNKSPVANRLTEIGTDVAKLKQVWLEEVGAPLPQYIPYDTGSLTNVNGEYRLTGKNLVFKTLTNGNINASGKITISTFDIHVAHVMYGQTYTLTSNDPSLVYAFYESEPQSNDVSYNGERVVSSGTVATFTAPITGYVAFRSTAGFAKAQCELGSTATAYEPFYNGGSIDCSAAPLNGVGTAVDEKDYATGERTTRCGMVDLGTLTFANSTASNVQIFKTGNSAIPDAKASDNTTPNTVCAIYSWHKNTDFATGDKFIVINSNGAVIIRDSSLTDASQLSLSGMMLCYELATPVTTTETPQPVYTQYGYNVLEPVSGGVQSAEVDTTYYENIAGYIDKKLAEG